MDHPNIAKVFDAGTTASGRPYFVMELVKGVPITEFCDQRRFTPRQRLELFATVCQAVQHAHQKGIIHRDLKPSNVLVTLHDTVAVPKVIDFGIAKATSQRLTERTLFTQFAQMVGTPLYMSPEQAELNGLDVDTRSDVYALGVLLYELLTGTTPFESEMVKKVGLDEMRRIIREEEPPTPSQRLNTLEAKACSTVSERRGVDGRRLGQVLRGELDWIVMKALEKDRNRRYQTANGLARDLQRYLAGEAVEAGPPSAGYRLRKFAHKYRTSLATAAAFLGLLLLGGAIATWQAVGLARADRDRAARERDEARLQAKRGQDLQEALGRIAVLRAQAGAAVPGDPAKWAEARALARRAEALLEGGPVEPELAERARALLVGLAEEDNDRRLVATLDEILLRQTETDVQRNRFAGELALPEYAAAFRAYGLAAGETDPAKAAARVRQRPAAIRDRLVAAMDDWALLAHQWEAQERDWVHQVVAAADPDDWRTRVRRARAGRDRAVLEQLAEAVDVARQPPLTLDLLGRSLGAAGAHESAVRLLRRARQRYPGDFWINHDLGHQLLEGKDKDQRADAVRFSTAAVALRPNSPGTHYNLGLALHEQGQLDEAIAAYRQAVELDPKYAAAHNNLGVALADQGKVDEAIQEYRAALRLDPKRANAHNNLGNALKAKGQLDEAIQEYHESLHLDPKAAPAHYNLGVALREKGRLDEAIQEYRAALRLDPTVASAHNGLGVARYEQGKVAEAIEEFRAALRLDPKHVQAHYNLGNGLREQGKFDEAIAAFRDAIRLQPDFGEAHCNLGHVFRRKGQYAEARASLRRGHELGSQRPGWKYPSAEWVRQAEQAVALDKKLPAILKGEAQSATVAERLTLARMCYDRAWYVAAARIWSDALAADPARADDLQAPHRYNAACAAARAGAGQAKDDPPPDAAAQAQLRRQARDWLQADLAAYAKHLDGKDPQAGSLVQQRLQHWKSDADLAGLRDPGAVANLPAEEQEACRQLWAEVEALLQKAREQAKP
jgi:serine/threonine-protein kinase